jgi:glycosyltransferase involved in cell wall biosynthesis
MPFAPHVTVIVPVYNRALLIEATLDSILAQTYRPAPEVLVVDDGSTDDTPRVLERYGDRIRVLAQPNQGASAARNLALRHASGEFIAFCDSDDLWTLNKLAVQMPLFEQHPGAGLVYGDFLCFEDATDGRREWRLSQGSVSGFIFGRLLERNFIVPSTAVVSRTAVEQVGAFDPECCNAEDYDYFLRVTARQEAVFTGHVVCRYRQHPRSASRQKERYWQGFIRSLEKAGGLLRDLQSGGGFRDPIDGHPVPSYQVKDWEGLVRRRLATFHLRLASWLLRQGDRERATTEALRALRLHPLHSSSWTVLWKVIRHRLGLRGTP